MTRATLLKVIFISFLFLYVSLQKVQAQSETVTNPEECQKLIDKGAYEIDRKQYSEALVALTKAEVIAENKRWNEKLFYIKNLIGNAYSSLSNYGEALSYYLESLKLADSSGTDEEIATALCNIGALYGTEKEPKKALYYYLKAYPLTVAKNSGFIRVTLGLNIADSYNQLGKFKEARRYLNEVKSITKPKTVDFMWRFNDAETLFLEGDLITAKYKLYNLLEDVDKNSIFYVYIYKLLSKIYIQQNDRAHSIIYANKGLENRPELVDKIDLYNQLATLYYQSNDINNYKRYNDSIAATKDSLSKVVNRGLYESNKVKLKVQEYQNETESYRQKQEAERRLFIIIALFTIILFISIYRALKNRITKQRQEKVIAEKQQQIISLELEQKNSQNLLLEQEMREKEIKALLEQEQLKNEIDKRNRQLSAKALNLSGRNQIIEDIIIAFGQNPKLKNDPKLLKHINDLKTNLKADGWDSFIVHFEEVNNNMLKRLQERHPALTPNDLRFIAYLYMNLSYKEIAVIFNITPINCAKRKERIARKMDIPGNLSIYNYISSI
jgi:tetratricopeptide (TPR) repeat protein